MFEQVIATFGRIDVLINNAGDPGGKAAGPLERLSDDDLLMDFDTKFMGCVRCTRAAAPHMQRQRWGRVVNIGGFSGRKAGQYAGAVRNLALSHLTRTIALELGRFGITVNLIHPGSVEQSDDLRDRRARIDGVSAAEIEARSYQNAVRRPVAPSEIAAAVAYFASTQAAAVTGETLAITGGTGDAVVL